MQLTTKSVELEVKNETSFQKTTMIDVDGNEYISYRPMADVRAEFQREIACYDAIEKMVNERGILMRGKPDGSSDPSRYCYLTFAETAQGHKRGYFDDPVEAILVA